MQSLIRMPKLESDSSNTARTGVISCSVRRRTASCKRLLSRVPGSVSGRVGCSPAQSPERRLPSQRAPGEGVHCQAPDGAEKWLQNLLGCGGPGGPGGADTVPGQAAGTVSASVTSGSRLVCLLPRTFPSQEHGFLWTLILEANRHRALCHLPGAHRLPEHRSRHRGPWAPAPARAHGERAPGLLGTGPVCSRYLVGVSRAGQRAGRRGSSRVVPRLPVGKAQLDSVLMYLKDKRFALMRFVHRGLKSLEAE